LSELFQFEVPATCAHIGPGYGVLGLAVDLTMAVKVERVKGDVHSVDRGNGTAEPADDVRHDPVLRGLHTAARELDLKLPPGLRVALGNQIPNACGLGTTSAAYAAGVAIAARFAREAKKIVSIDTLLRVLVDLGGDPGHGAAALQGGLVACCAVDGAHAFRVLPHAVHDSWRVVLAIPRFQLGASEVRRLLPASLPHGSVSRSIGRVVGLLRALAAGDEDLLAQCIVDEVHVPYRRAALPGTDAAMRAAIAAGAAGATISGAGPAIVALTTQHDRTTAIGRSMLDAFAGVGLDARTLTLGVRLRGGLPGA
jgi:homoserine kinase